MKGFIASIERAAGGLPLGSMPDWARPIVAWSMPRVGPRGLEFACARVEMKVAECASYPKRLYPERMKQMIPDHVRAQVASYGLTPAPAGTDDAEPPIPRDELAC